MLLVKPLFEVDSLSKYINYHSSNKIKDIQPVRDLTFYINVLIKKHFDISTFHLTNMLLTLGLVFLFNRLTRVLGLSIVLSAIVTFIFAFHPIIVSSIGWVSARKHSLSIIFCLLTIIQLYRHKKVTNKSIVFFLFSIFSHPITILLPAWVIILKKIRVIKKLGTKFYMLCGVSLLGFSANYFKVIALGHGNTVSISERSFDSTVSSAILSFGRSLSFIFTPMKFGATYYEGHIMNLTGLLVLGCIILIYKKFGKKEDIIAWCSLFLITNITYFHIFVHDTYLYLGLITQFIILAKIIDSKKSIKVKKVMMSISLLLILPYFIFQFNYTSKMWLNNLILWQRSYENERSPHTQLVLGSKIIDDDQLLGFEFVKNGSLDFDFTEHYGLLKMYLLVIYRADKVPIQKRIKLLEEKYKKGLHKAAVFMMFYSLTLMKGDEQQALKGFNLAKELLDGNYIKIDSLLKFYKEELSKYCKNEDSPYRKYCKMIRKGLI